MKLNEQQKAVLKQLVDFSENDAQFFILKGYAGTGKTTLVSQYIDWLQEREKPFELLATTGRAAKILKDKTGHKASTIHSAIYSFKDIEGDVDHVKQVAGSTFLGQLSLIFGTKPPLDDGQPLPMLIIDEASMLSSVADSSDAIIRFGSGILINDLIEYANGAKIIFVGDPCQLPPVGSLHSVALDKYWLETTYGTEVEEAELTSIMRQDKKSGISSVAATLRDRVLDPPSEKWPKIPALRKEKIILYDNREDFVNTYVGILQRKGFQEAICIAWANKECLEINMKVRQQLYGEHGPLRKGDILMVMQNNYLTDVVNGDLVKVHSLKGREERAGLVFLKVEIENVYSKKIHEVRLIENLLNSVDPNITKDQHRALMVDFSGRMYVKGVGSKSNEYKQEMLKDPYLNALRAQYGYAVTCHKSQGGEWPQIFLLLSPKMYGMDRSDEGRRDQLMRWLYTAVTRAEKKLHLEKGWWLE